MPPSINYSNAGDKTRLDYGFSEITLCRRVVFGALVARVYVAVIIIVLWLCFIRFCSYTTIVDIFRPLVREVEERPVWCTLSAWIIIPRSVMTTNLRLLFSVDLGLQDLRYMYAEYTTLRRINWARDRHRYSLIAKNNVLGRRAKYYYWNSQTKFETCNYNIYTAGVLLKFVKMFFTAFDSN